MVRHVVRSAWLCSLGLGLALAGGCLPQARQDGLDSSEEAGEEIEGEEVETIAEALPEEDLERSFDWKADSAANLWDAQRIPEIPVGTITGALRELIQKAKDKGRIRIILVPKVPPSVLLPQGSMVYPAAVLEAGKTVLEAAGALNVTLPPFGRRLTALVSADVLERIGSNPAVEAIYEDTLLRPVLAESAVLSGAAKLWTGGVTGQGTAVAVLDSGVDRSHPFLAGRVTDGACFSSIIPQYNVKSLCPSGNTSEFGPAAGNACSGSADCAHGTHVAGIVGGDNGTLKGVAPGVRIIPVQVFSRIDDVALCGGAASCISAWDSDVTNALDWVFQQRAAHNTVAVNMSLGGGGYTTNCDFFTAYKDAIDRLRGAGIAAVVAAGNDGYVNGLSSPGCISSAVSVGAVDKQQKQMTWFTNVAPFLKLLSYGYMINSSVPGGGYGSMSGTSMAAPHVAGFWALAKSRKPAATVDEVLNAMTSTGTMVPDNRIGGTGQAFPLVNALAALKQLDPAIVVAPDPTPVPTVQPTVQPTLPPPPPPPPPPKVTKMKPASGKPGTTVTLTGANFKGAKKVLIGKVKMLRVKVINARKITAVIPKNAKTGKISVVTAAGTGMSGGKFTVKK